MQRCIYSKLSQCTVESPVKMAVHIQWCGRGFGAVCGECVSVFPFLIPTNYKNIIRGLRMVIQSIKTLFTIVVIWCRPGSFGDTATNQTTNKPKKKKNPLVRWGWREQGGNSDLQGTLAENWIVLNSRFPLSNQRGVTRSLLVQVCRQMECLQVAMRDCQRRHCTFKDQWPQLLTFIVSSAGFPEQSFCFVMFCFWIF